MRFWILLLFTLIGIRGFSQLHFSVSGYGAGYKDGDIIFLSYRTPNGFIEDSVRVKAGYFAFSGIISSPVRASLYRNQNPKYANVIFDATTVYLEKGNVVLRSADTLRHSVNSGTPLNRDYAMLKASLQPYYEKTLTLKDPFELSEQELRDTAMVQKIKGIFFAHMDSMVPVKFAFVRSHPSSFVSVETLMELIRDSRWLDQVEQCFNRLSPDLKSHVLSREISKRISLGKQVAIGMTAKDFTQPDQYGQLVKLSDFKGKYVLIDFWASWCGPCRAENPNVLAAFNRYKQHGFTVLSISIDQADDREKWLKAIREDGMIWPQLSDLKGNDNLPYKLYGITTIPANVLIDPQGKVIGKDLKREDLQTKLSTLFKYTFKQ